MKVSAESRRPVIYHCISRVVDRRFAFLADEKEKLRMFMRMYENFSGCRVLAYCLMSNHIHVLLEVTPMPEGGLTDAALLSRLRAIYNEAQVAEVAGELAEARQKVAEGNGKKARAGLVRAVRAHKGVGADAELWKGDVALEYRRILLAGAGERVEERVERSGEMKKVTNRKGLTREELAAEKQRLLEAAEKRMGEIPFGRMLRCRVRYFTDGAVIGSRAFVDEMFEAARHRFGPKRKDGARKLRGDANAAAGILWSMRDLRKPVEESRD
jgi:REP element-mobilizing transposase RayT